MASELESPVVEFFNNSKAVVDSNPETTVGKPVIDAFSKLAGLVKEEQKDNPLVEEINTVVDRASTKGPPISYADLYALAGQLLDAVRE